jgi:hypothetical protein
MRLSHTAKEMYLTCPKKWQLHYQEKLRSTLIGSALFFGSAIDEALNRMLLEKKKNLTDEEKELMDKTVENTFIEHFTKARIVDEYVDISKSSQAMYYKSDLDISLLEPKDHKAILIFANELGLDVNSYEDICSFTEECQVIFKKGSVDNETQRMYNYICWLSLRNRGLMLLDAYRVQIMPEIEEVFDVQKKISLPDSSDEFVGVIDLICSFTSEPGVRYVCDNKTSSRPYKSDSVQTSEQLAAYSEYEQNNKCAYIVIVKKLRKREPRVRCTIIKDTMPNNTVDETFDKLTNVFHKIDEKKFDKDFDACYQYGRKCEYYSKCRTGDLKNLKYVKEKNNANKERVGRSNENIKSKDQGTDQRLERSHDEI